MHARYYRRECFCLREQNIAGNKKKKAKSSIICLLFGSRAPAMGVHMRFLHSRAKKEKKRKDDSPHSYTLSSFLQSSNLCETQFPETPFSTLLFSSSQLPTCLRGSASVVARGEVAYLCSCQSAASSSAGAPASRALLSPSPAWLS